MTAPLDQVKTLHEAGLFSSSKLLVSVQFSSCTNVFQNLTEMLTQTYFRLCERLNPEIAEIN